MSAELHAYVNSINWKVHNAVGPAFDGWYSNDIDEFHSLFGKTLSQSHEIAISATTNEYMKFSPIHDVQHLSKAGRNLGRKCIFPIPIHSISFLDTLR
jgi:hypothetical protein